MATSNTKKHNRTAKVFHRLYNGKYHEAKQCLKGSEIQEDDRELIIALGVVFGNTGWDGSVFQSYMGDIIEGAVRMILQKYGYLDSDQRVTGLYKDGSNG